MSRLNAPAPCLSLSFMPQLLHKGRRGVCLHAQAGTADVDSLSSIPESFSFQTNWLMQARILLGRAWMQVRYSSRTLVWAGVQAGVLGGDVGGECSVMPAKVMAWLWHLLDLQ